MALASPSTEWNTGLFDCCEDVGSGCYGFWCCPCLACAVSRRFGESFCLPLCDICSPAIFTAFGIPLFAPPVTIGVRAAIRTRYNIKGSVCKDITAACFCVFCSWCQMHRELIHRVGNNTTVVNMQPAPVKDALTDPPPDGHVASSGVILASF